MCGRFTLTSAEGLAERFNIIEDFLPEQLNISYNVAPGQPVLSVIHTGSERRMGHLRWGFIPRWAKEEKIGYKMINARAETLAEKPSFKKPLQTQRCLIVTDGFYEWKKTDDKKQPYRLTLKDKGIFSFAGLWEKWQSPSGDAVFSCTIITTKANEVMQDIHHRMPVIIAQEDESAWLDPENSRKPEELLLPFPSDHMDIYPVSAAVNNAKNNSPDLIQPVGQ
ncbi:SOS response-associated peptidase [Salipaludibacillus aurantiacus]|uniref:Abasic site processing protein n=1 Tax=Salipaludibacillus aurantiacus TaxID=1601833 RepID=A0A1H9VI98_9BACI|nr:SOS response-associated peptidase [Salipaludibacillus aurantiacus]SES21372.1 Putative SOS response-associated peptidase YedK [Salipaludibacillus aurantiacus]